MSPKAKNKLLPSVRVSEELYNATVELAEQENEYLSDYIRKAVEQRNTQHVIPLQPNSNMVTQELKVEPLNEWIDRAKEHTKGGKIEKPKQEEFKTFFKK